jgi:3'-phosphoadenosine 5'-phosphosulfate sulfotransferase (PAPS reductase)/FAD synthetase
MASTGQGGLWTVRELTGPGVPADGPPLDGYHVILVNISGGKDSQATLDVTLAAADAAGVRDRIVVVFADLGEADEWPGTLELAREHAENYGVRFEVVCREVTGDDGARRPQGLIEHIEKRGMWPDAARRYCTSDAKRAPVYRLMTRLAAEHRDAGVEGPVRILNVMGLRAQESPGRRLLAPFSHDDRASNSRRHVDLWLPVHGWNVTQVWDRIEQAGTRPHWVYLLGMPRLSCRFCVLASRAALVLAARIDLAGARRRAEAEDRMGHRFRLDLSMREVVAAAEAAGPVTAAEITAAGRASRQFTAALMTAEARPAGTFPVEDWVA